MEFANGATGVFITTTGDAPGTNRLEITGTKGRIICENDQLTYDKLEEDERIWCVECREGFRKPESRRIEVETDGQNPQHAGVLNALPAHIASRCAAGCRRARGNPRIDAFQCHSPFGLDGRNRRASD